MENAKAKLPAGAAEKQEPTLAEMTKKSISLLDGASKKGCLLQIEGALIDKRSHANDAEQTLDEVKAVDDAVKAAVDFDKKDGHTLVVVTADHECAGFDIIERGTFTNAEAAAPPVNVDSGNTANNSTPSRAVATCWTGPAPPASSTVPARVTRRTSPRPPSAPPTTPRASRTAPRRPASG
ncbi:alkaline phosphatase [Streptomyces sp. NPDC047453]|uniref:alkaline phosphatase n=1 Tax=Streptomyces sp. NPDC047453 TaxID=3154812 RepID=UPI0033D16391